MPDYFFESDCWPLFWFPSILIVKTDPVTEPDGLEVESRAHNSKMEFNEDGLKVEPRIIGGREANPRKSYFLQNHFSFEPLQCTYNWSFLGFLLSAVLLIHVLISSFIVIICSFDR